MNILKQIRQTIGIRARIRNVRETPRLFKQHLRYAFRRALMPQIVVPMWVTSKEGTRFYLSKDFADDEVVQDILKRHADYFPDLSNSCTDKQGVLLEIGGHHGLYAAEALRTYAGHKLVVVEPHPESCELIRKQVTGNNSSDRCRIIDACLAEDTSGRVLKVHPEWGTWGATVLSMPSASATLPVKSVTLKDILESETPSLIHCNAEGAEFTMVQQLAASHFRPCHVVIMVHEEFGDVELARNTMRDIGYEERVISDWPGRQIFAYSRPLNYSNSSMTLARVRKRNLLHT